MSKLKTGHSDFDQGILFALAMLIRTHDEPTMAADVLRCTDMAKADVSKLDPYDQHPLRKLNGESNIKLTGFSKEQP